MWEYTSVEDSDLKKVLVKLNDLGKDGWEAFQVNTLMSGEKIRIYLKRNLNKKEQT